MCQIIVQVLIRIENQKGERCPKMRQKPKQAKDVSSEWRSCMVYVWSPAISCWIKHNRFLTVKPGESCRKKEIEIAREGGYDWHEVVLSPCLDAE